MRRAKRYFVRATPRGCTLTLAPAYGGCTHEFFARDVPSYVWEEYEGHPGTLGRQVCDSLFGVGPTIIASKRSVSDAIRMLARRYCDRIDRGEE